MKYNKNHTADPHSKASVQLPRDGPVPRGRIDYVVIGLEMPLPIYNTYERITAYIHVYNSISC